ncbi:MULTISPECIES: hypothetical protein [unclassified Clostridium]|uniref:hypothetical protein n=1 Tax=unclassified Clostridium TaxID=2614128 RepID=UPI002079B1D1|nr:MULTISPECIES: hypothetical protein [unclassified Clostridium]
MKLVIDTVNNKISLNNIDITDSVKEIKVKAKDFKKVYTVLEIPIENVDMK